MNNKEFVTADTHFGHTNIIKYSNRPFKNAYDMTEELIRKWNNKVPAGAMVYHLGDFSMYKPEMIHNILNRLNGKICLVKGNHDKNIKKDLVSRFEWVKDYHESTTPTGTKVVMFHYAMLVWNKCHYGSWSLHGHSHGSLKADKSVKRLDVGIDTQGNYEPYSFAEVENIMNSKKIVSVDHHKERK